MAKIDKKSLFAELNRDYHKKHRKSEAIFKEASRYLVKGGSHNLRLFEHYPFYDVRSNGSKVTDADGNVYIDFWQGHFANILGHNPPVVLDALADYFQKGQGLTTGFPGTSRENSHGSSSSSSERKKSGLRRAAPWPRCTR